MSIPLSPDDERKLDSGMSVAYRTWKENPDLSPDAAIAVSLQFTGDLGQIEALGFENEGVFGDQALGLVHFKDVARLVAHDGVLWIAAGRSSRKDLDTAVHDIRARASAPISGSTAVDGVWHADASSGALTHIPKATGKGVIVAIMDTGIDYTHPMFISKTTGKTRILRIWDQGLTPATVAECPPFRLLVSTDTYGVEFKNTQIDASLSGGAAIAHRDCDGHGTHVAGIAAGGTNFTTLLGDAKRVGVAPEADIIAVKFLDNPEKIYYKLASGATGSDIPETRRFADGVMYCLRTAKELGNRPVVINMSFGDDSYPGDGLDEDARFVDAVLDPTKPPGDKNFPTGAVVVKSAGNEGTGRTILARVEVPASGQIIVPFELTDQRDEMDTNWQHCRQEPYKPDMGIHFWYRYPGIPLAVQFAVRSPFDTAGFSADVSAGAKLELGINAVTGPPPIDIAVPFAPNVHRVTIDHKTVAPVPHPAGGTVQRHYAHVFVGPKVSGGVASYHLGIWEVRITAPAGTVFFVKGARHWWNEGSMFFRVNEKLRDGTPRHTNIKLLTESTTLDPLGRYVITVAAYNDLPFDDFGTPVPAGAIAEFSSRGPMRDYSNPPLGPVGPKPDIAGPGVAIDSALSRHTEGLLHWPWWYWGVRFQELGGTSMSTPMIAGVVALMLEKKPNLNVTQVRGALSSAPRAAVEPSTPPDSTRAYGVGMVDAMTSHAKA